MALQLDGARTAQQASWQLAATRRLAPLAIYLLLALWTTWPLARFPTTTLPLAAEPVATVPLFNTWTIWWNADRLAHGFRDYWDAPIFHPVADEPDSEADTCYIHFADLETAAETATLARDMIHDPSQRAACAELAVAEELDDI